MAAWKGVLGADTFRKQHQRSVGVSSVHSIHSSQGPIGGARLSIVYPVLRWPTIEV